jgi:hypothetical protein
LTAGPPGSDWLHEVKQTGLRILARKQGERAKIWSRRGADFSDRFPTIAHVARQVSADRSETPIRLRSEVGGDEALGLDAEGSVDAEAGLARPIGLPATCQLQSIAKPLSVDANAVP